MGCKEGVLSGDLQDKTHHASKNISPPCSGSSCHTDMLCRGKGR